MDYIIYNGQLYHHGIKGMKWGRRRWQTKDGSLTPAGRQRYNDSPGSQRREARKAYKSATDKAFKKYERDIEKIEKPYKRGQMLSKKDQDRENEVEARYQSDVAKAKADYKAAKRAIKNDPENVAKRKEAAKKAAIAAAAVAGTALAVYGAYKVNQYVKTKNCEIAAARGKKFAMDEFFTKQDTSFRRFEANKDILSIGLEMDVNASARSSANKAAKDNFRTAAKNVMSYKKSGGRLSNLATLDRYRDEDWYKFGATRGR